MNPYIFFVYFLHLRKQVLVLYLFLKVKYDLKALHKTLCRAMEIYWMVANSDTWLEKSQLTKRRVSSNNSA